MAKKPAKVPVQKEKEETGSVETPEAWRPLDSLRREVDRLFEDFDRSFWRRPSRPSVFDLDPFWHRELSWGGTPAVDIVEKDTAYEVTAELPGMDEKDIDVKVSDSGLTIKGEKSEETEEEEKGYYLHERRFGSFERRFAIPETVDTDKIAAAFKNGVLTVTLPKKPEAQTAEKKIEVKAA